MYIYDGDYLTANLRKELVRFDQRMDYVTFAVNHLWHIEDDCKKLTPQCQFRHLHVKWVREGFSITDAMHDPKYEFNYISMVGGMAVNRQLDRQQTKILYRHTAHSFFFSWHYFVNHLRMKSL